MYLLRCADDSLYCGWTVDLERRLAAHRRGTGSRYVRRRLPVEVALAVRVRDRSTAMREEARIKRLPRREKLALVSAGTLDWRDEEGRLHREDGPARVFGSGREEWYRHGKLHREDGPAVVHANGSVKWYRDGVRHRDDGPACVYVNGTEKWYRHGLRHRDDGPAASYPDGRRIWFVDGRRVREERVA